VKAKALTPGSTNWMVKVRSHRAALAEQLVKPLAGDHAAAVGLDVAARVGARRGRRGSSAGN
jgi:hypothetical protein